jgi:hypothetical protein
MAMVAHELCDGVALIRLLLWEGGGSGSGVFIEGAEDLLLGVVDVDDGVFVGLVGETDGEGGIQLNSPHDLIEDVIVGGVLHGW